MKITIEVTDEKQLALIEKLRGTMTQTEFIRRALEAGVKLAARNAQRPSVKFAQTRPEFKTLDVAAITAALKDPNLEHPVRLEISRLVTDYTNQIREHSKKNGNRLPQSLKVQTQVPIERVAFQLTAEAISNAVKAANKKAVGK